MERKNNKNEILGTSYDARISELKQQISILENEKCEVEEKLSSYMEGLIKTKENGHFNDTVRATYQDLVMMGVGINNIEKVVCTILTNFTNMNIECLPKATFARLMYTESTRLRQLQVIIFENFELSKDDVYNSLILPSNILDESTKQCLEIIFGSLCIITRRMLDDHLEDGKYSNPSQQLMKETVSVSTTNSIAERNFGMLDRFIREKPNANMITYESIIMNRTKKTPESQKK